MLAWMLYAIVASVLIGAAALALEHAMHGMRRPARFVWVAAMTLSVGWPVLMLTVPRHETIDAPVSIRSSVSGGVHTVSNTVALASQRALNVSVETIVLTVWALLSALLLARVLHAAYTNAVRARGWRFATVDGVQVRTSTDVGPAVVGIASMEVVLPEWVLALDRALLDLVLAHEQEHRDARDPILLFGAAAVVCLMPWNIGLIWQARRLRSAMEIDCDARVLKRYPDTERYGLLLLAIAQRRSSAFPVLGPTMSEPAANLSRRFAAMKNNQVSRARLAALCTFGVAAIVAACAIDAPTALQAEELPIGVVRAEILPASQTDTADMMRYIVKGENGAPDLQLVFPTKKFDDRRLLELSESLMVEFGKALERTGSNEAAVEAVLEIIARIERLLGGPVQVSIGNVKLTSTVREISEKPVQPVTHERRRVDDQRPLEQRRVVVEEGVVGSAQATLLPKRMDSTMVSYDFQVERQASLKEGTYNPSYPAALKAAGIEGEVLAQFVVGTDGRPDLATLKVLKSTEVLFTESVRTALEQAVFTPASVGGRPVKQLVQLPFRFSIHQ